MQPLELIAPDQVRAARRLLGWSQMELGLKASVNQKTVAQFEIGRHRPIEQTVSAIRRALEAAGVEFGEGESGPRLKKPASK